ncbi:hypothetical protein DL96DRAFT_391629 [Flagelloscypha sp. PMI_526]|nr:hypothetical protein DL96DRAFT_391629 [Flagelloscypha sp. PMI_526]
MSDIVIREVSKDVWTFSRPFTRGFFGVGGRSVAIRLRSQEGVWVMASTPLSPDTKQTIDNLGSVKYIVGADRVHYLFLKEYQNAYPQAKLIMPNSAIERATNNGVTGLTVSGTWGKDPEGTKYGFEDEIEHCYFSGFINRDIAFLHKPSETMIEADLLFNLPAKEQYDKVPSKPLSLGFGPYHWFHGIYVWLMGQDKAAMRRDAKTVNAWNFDRIIPCHEVIETGGKKAWSTAYAHWLK